MRKAFFLFAAGILIAGCARKAPEGPQGIGLEGVSNAWQLGGYEAAEGRRVRADVLLRSASLEKATKADIGRLKSLRLTTVIDFRTEEERMATPDPEIPGVKFVSAEIRGDSNLMGMSGGRRNLAQLESLLKSGIPVGQFKKEIVEDESAKKGFAEFFRQLLTQSPDEAILWHCSSGKERTGCAAALLLSVLGVGREAILDDYELTNKFLSQRISAAKSQVARHVQDPAAVEAVGRLVGVSRSFMSDLLGYLDQTYGSAENYVRQEFGLSPEEIQALRDKYLEP